MVTKVITENSTGGDFAGEVDARMNESAPTTSDNAAIETLSSGVSTRFRSLLKFTGLSNIPANATIVSVSLDLYVELVDGDCETRLFKVLRNWSSPTWNQYTSGSNWTTGGCDGVFTDRVVAVSAIKSIVSADAGNYRTWTDGQMRSDVQTWVEGSAVNNGWLIQNTNDTTNPGTGAVFGHALGTDSHRPKLTVDYTVPDAGVNEQMTVDLYF